MTAATSEPSAIVAGDTAAWTKSLADYPASAWTLKYRAVKSGAYMQITATASGSDHAISVSATTTSGWTAGIYDVQGWVENGAATERYTVYTGRLEVKPNLAAQTDYDARSTARKIYDALVVQYQTHVTNGQAFVGEYEISGRRMKFNAKPDWLLEINFWKREVAAEDRAEKLAAGQGSGSKLYTRF